MPDWSTELEAQIQATLDERDRLSDQLERTLRWLEDALPRNQIVHAIDRQRAQELVDEGRALIYRRPG